MYNTFTFLVIIFTGITVAVLLLLLLRSDKRGYGGEKGNNTSGTGSSCPICGSGLKGNERVKSVLFPGSPDRMMEIYGCPRCYPSNPEIKRICPVCGKELAPESVLIARAFIKPGRKHVHVLGCSECYRRKY